MAVLTEDRNTKVKHQGRSINVPMAAATEIFKGAGVSVNATGFAVPMADTAGELVIGVADSHVDNPGADGVESIRVFKGVHAFNADAGDPPTQADVGRPVYVATDNEVQVIGGAVNNIVAGTLDSIVGTDFFVNIFDQA